MSRKNVFLIKIGAALGLGVLLGMAVFVRPPVAAQGTATTAAPTTPSFVPLTGKWLGSGGDFDIEFELESGKIPELRLSVGAIFSTKTYFLRPTLDNGTFSAQMNSTDLADKPISIYITGRFVTATMAEGRIIYGSRDPVLWSATHASIPTPTPTATKIPPTRTPAPTRTPTPTSVGAIKLTDGKWSGSGGFQATANSDISLFKLEFTVEGSKVLDMKWSQIIWAKTNMQAPTLPKSIEIKDNAFEVANVKISGVFRIQGMTILSSPPARLSAQFISPEKCEGTLEIGSDTLTIIPWSATPVK